MIRKKKTTTLTHQHIKYILITKIVTLQITPAQAAPCIRKGI